MRLSKIQSQGSRTIGEHSHCDISLKHAHSPLRFGAAALQWKNCTTMQDYISHGLYQSAAMYIVSICAILFWNKIAPRDLAFVSVIMSPRCYRSILSSHGIQWNYILLSGTFAYELLFIFSPSTTDPSGLPLSSLIFADPVSPSTSGWFGFFWPSRVAYQHVTFLKSLSVLLSSALYQVLPTIFPSNPETLDARQLSTFLNVINNAVRTVDSEGD